MEHFTPQIERLSDCAVLSSLCSANLKTPIVQYLAILDAHAASNCLECAAIARADQLMELEAEAPCSCHQSDVDLFDSRGCEYHDVNSPYNVRLRAIGPVQQYEREVA